MELIDVIRYGDSALLVQFEQKVEVRINRAVHALNQWLLQQEIIGVQGTIPAYCSLTVCFDPTLISFAEMSQRIVSWSYEDPSTPETNRVVRIPVCYEEEYAMDMSWVEHYTRRTKQEIIDDHTHAIYHTYMIGFLPGFPYLGKLPETLQVPRHSEPRLKVPRGAVGLAGDQTGIYPCAAPGGWQIIGQTPIPLFDGVSGKGALLQAGDRVQFFAVSPQVYRMIARDIESGNFNLKSLYVW
ncbi:hypothetical protein BFP72_11305 [Reichenbachiella sp. 5M10]|uniref:5-oxoprolinase subunit PxpB n=1 Tax=Reichenbachiella sp. 5M10 TaxID=1889772 RepID=UPI000C14C817|nr:5-oxoprolinase subunit PxpB [Reichenbachiella sp. 5M10]PIB35939.1 hypothetical protein BFP72_11305 [Reichenbachiella sp. 5M10]